MKKILLYTTSFLPSVGGTERATYLLAQQLVKNGYDVTIVTRTPDPEQKFPDGKEGMRIVRNPGLFELRDVCKKHDLMIINGGYSVRAWLGVVQTSVPFAIIHAMITSGLREGFQPLDIVGNLLRKRMKSSAARHVGVSSEVLKAANVEGMVIPNMIDPEILKLAESAKPQQKKYDLVFVGRLIATKGLQHVLNAMAALKQSGQNVTLAVVGGGEYESRAKQLVSELEIAEQVEFLGYQSAAELAETYSKSRILIHTPDAPEGFGMGLIEAMAFGLPVIVNDKPALPETAGNAGKIVPHADLDALTKAISELCTDEESYRIYSKAAKNRALNFLAEKVFEMWEDLIGEL